MNQRTIVVLSVALSALAGFVDAQGYMALGGLFVAFMSGNSTVLGIAVTEGAGARTLLAAGLVGAFVAGVMLGTMAGRPFGDRRAPVILVLMAALLAVAAVVARAGDVTGAGLVIALAMGTENTVFQRNGIPGIGLTYMTGTLVRLGQRLAEALAGGTWRPVLSDALLWTGMVFGAGLGAAASIQVGLDGLWAAVAVSAVLALVALAGVRGRAAAG